MMIVTITYKDGTIQNVEMTQEEFGEFFKAVKDGKHPDIAEWYSGNISP
ncbi:hypothetical protein H6G25_08935 [Dolichospermum sp. FACHB-1091]|nr:hypothetical protein [Dolichospermum sp. FACHB-1091]MBD2443315.1 hypothetical protein [Dolichospermum sp. FACHB-1091]